MSEQQVSTAPQVQHSSVGPTEPLHAPCADHDPKQDQQQQPASPLRKAAATATQVQQQGVSVPPQQPLAGQLQANTSNQEQPNAEAQHNSMQIDSQAPPAQDAQPAGAAAQAGRPSPAKRGRPTKDKQSTPRKKPCPEHADAAAAAAHGLSAADLLQQQAAAAAAGIPLGSAWPQVLLQQQQLLSFVTGTSATAESAGKQRKQSRKPPKTAGQQQGKGEGCCFSLERPFGGLSAATGHHSLMPPGFQQQQQQAAWVLQQQAQQLQQQQHSQHGGMSAADALKSLHGQLGDAGAANGSAGLKTRLSVRSVAYLEELLQQTAQAAGRSAAGTTTAAAPAGSGAGGSGSSGSQPAPQARPATHKGTAVTSRLSVGNLLISPPMSRAPSTCVNHLPAGMLETITEAAQDKGAKVSPGARTAAKNKAPAAAGAAHAQTASGAEQPAAPSTGTQAAAEGTDTAAAASDRAEPPDKEKALLPLNLAFPQAPSKGASPAVSGVEAAAGRTISKATSKQERSTAGTGTRTSTRQLLAATMAALEQQQQLAAAAGLLPVPPAPASRRSRIGIPQLQAAVAAAAAAAVAGVTAAAPASGNPDSPAQRKLPTAAEINRAAAAAVAAFQSAAAAAAAARQEDGSSSDTSSSGDDDRAAMDAVVWTAYKSGMGGTPDGPGMGSAERLKRSMKLTAAGDTSLSDTDSPPSSPDSPRSRPVLGVFAGSAGAAGRSAGAQGMLGASQLGSLQASAQDKLPLHARKSDRQVGLETVSRIDAIFQQLRSLQPPVGLAGGGSVPAAAADGTAAPGASRPNSGGSTQGGDTAAAALAGQPGAAGALAAVAAGAGSIAAAIGAGAAGAASAAEVMGCSVAALCRGLRYEGDITLKEVAMAFQLRDAYDWDEDLEAAAAQEAKKREDPRFKDIKAVAKPANSCDSSVCPDPEPVPGFQPRSTWMAGQRASVSPTHSGLAAQRGASRQHPGHHAGGIAPSIMQRLHRQSSQQSNSQAGSINSSRRASLVGSPVNLPDVPDPMAPAALQAALTAAVTAAFSGQNPQGVAAMLPGLLASSPVFEHGVANHGAAAGSFIEMYNRALMAGTGAIPTNSGSNKRGSRKRKGDSDDEYDPRKPSHNQEFSCRKPYDRRSSMGNSQQPQQQLQQQQVRRMTSTGSWCAGSSGVMPAAMQQAFALAGAAGAAMLPGMQPGQQWPAMEQQQQQRKHTDQPQGSSGAQPSQQHTGGPTAAAANTSGSIHQQQQASGAAAAAAAAGAPVRSRPSYVKRRLIGGAASSWLHMQDGLATSQQQQQQQAPGLQQRHVLDLSSPQAGLSCPAAGGAAQKAGSAGTAGAGRKSQSTSAAAAAVPQRPGRGRRPSYAQLEAGNFSEAEELEEAATAARDDAAGSDHDTPMPDARDGSDAETQSDSSDAEAEYSAGRGRGRRGRVTRGGGRGRGTRGRGRGRLGTDSIPGSPVNAAAPAAGAMAVGDMAQDAMPSQPAAAAAAGDMTVKPDLDTAADNAGDGRGRGRGRSQRGRGRGRASVAAASSADVLSASPAVSTGRMPVAAGGAAVDGTAAASLAAAAAAGGTGGFTVGAGAAARPSGGGRGGRRGQARGRGAFAGRSSPLVYGSSPGPQLPPAAAAAGGANTKAAGSGRGSGRGRGSRGGRQGRGAGRSISTDSPAAAGSAGTKGAGGGGAPTPGSRGCGLKSMPSWFAAGLLPDALDSSTAAELLPAPSGPAGGIAGLAIEPAGALQPQAQQSLLSPNTMQLQQLTRAACQATQQQQGKKGWVTQVADGGVLVPMPAEGPLQEGGDIAGIDPLSDLMLMGERVDVGAGDELGGLL